MKFPAWLFLMLLAGAPVWSQPESKPAAPKPKPKIDVQVKVFNGIGRDRVAGSLSKSDTAGSNTNESTIYERVFYFNVTITSERRDPALAKNNGQWCITGENELSVDQPYDAELDGNKLEVEVPSKNGKARKYRYVVFDRQWRKLDNL